MENKTGSVLILSFVVTSMLLVFTYSSSIRGLVNLKSAYTSVVLSKAFHVADSGVDEAIVKLQSSTSGFWSLCDETPQSYLVGEYTGEYVVKCSASNLRTITSSGTAKSGDGRTITRTVEVYGSRGTASNLFDNALYAAEGIELQGNTYGIVGDILTGYMGTIDNTDNVQGDVIQDENAAPLPDLDFSLLREIAVQQGNYFDAWTIKFRDIPSSFYYAPGIPNVVFIEDVGLTLKANDVVGGFIILYDAVLTPAVTLNGNASVHGAIYAKGDFTVNGGGHTLNVDGSVLSGGTATLNGGIDIQYNQEYMNMLEGLGATLQFDILSWREL